MCSDVYDTISDFEVCGFIKNKNLAKFLDNEAFFQIK